MRAGIIGDVVNEYRDAMKDGTVFPPVVVFFDGSTHWLADGYHRWHAASEAGIETLQCDVKQGSKRDAILYACGANACNGLRRTNEDKQRAVKTLLTDAEWCQWSDRVIADKCGVNHTTVGYWRSQLVESTSCNTRKGKDGKSRKAPKRKPKKSPIAATVKPDALQDASGKAIATGDFRVESSHPNAANACPHCGGHQRALLGRGELYCQSCDNTRNLKLLKAQITSARETLLQIVANDECNELFGDINDELCSAEQNVTNWLSFPGHKR